MLLAALAASAAATWPSCYDARNCDGVDFAGLSLWHSTFSDATYRTSSWAGVGFGGSRAQNTDFTGATLTDAYANHVNFHNAILRDADLSGAYFDHSTFTGADLTGATVTDATDFNAASYSAATRFPDGNTWLGTSFFATSVRGMRVKLDGEDISGMNISPGADPVRFASFAGCSFTRVRAVGTRFAGGTYTGAAFWAVTAHDADFSGADLTGVPLHWSNLQRADFRNAVLAGTGLTHCSMNECKLEGADLSAANVDSTTRMLGCTYDAATQFPAGFDPAAAGLIDPTAAQAPSWPSCYDARNCDGVDFALTPESLWYSTFSDATYRTSSWAGVGFGGSRAQNTDFTGATLTDAYANHVNFHNAILRDADLSGAYFDHSTFTGADLTGATVTDATDFNAASYSAATRFPDGNTWLGTSFFATSVRGMRVKLDGEDISGMNISPGADPVRFASFAGCSFTRVRAVGTRFAGGTYTGAAFWAVTAHDADFSGADLTGVPLHWSNLQRADFRNAVLAGTGLTHCSMVGCNLRGADLSAANVDSTTDMAGCVYSDATQFPAGFDPAAAGLRHEDETPAPPTPVPPTPRPPTPAPQFPVPQLADVTGNTLDYAGLDCFPMGINPAGVSYWSTAEMFRNAFAESGGCCWPVDTQTDEDGNLLAADDGTNPDYWVAGRNVLFRTDGDYPNGEYILRAQGAGTITLHWDSGSHEVAVPTDPAGYAVNVTSEVNSPGVQLTIVMTSAADPVRNVTFMLREYDEDPSPTPSAFTPQYVASLQGMQVLRFMDLGRTNDNNVVRWADRSTTHSISQTRTIGRVWDVTSVTLPTSVTANGFTRFAIELTTAGAHGVSSGQMVTVTDLRGNVTVTREGEADLLRDLGDVWWPKMAEATGPDTLRITISEWWWTDSYTPVALEGGAAGRVELQIRPGVAYEHMLDLAKEVGTDPWFCVPHLADDDYVHNMATLIASAGLGADRTVYVELSNEVWNGMFSQAQHAEARKRELGMLYSSRYYGHRSKQVFDIFAAAFAAVPGAPQLNRVLATQSVNSWISEQAIIGAGGAGTFDSLASAPYFGASAADVFAMGSDGASLAGVTVDDVLQLCLRNVFEDFTYDTQRQKAVADAHGAALVAYEGGQHLGGGGPHPLGGWLADDAAFQDLMIAANRDPRMHNVYNEYFRFWGHLGGGLFAHFSHIGKPSKYGSWGVKESHYRAGTVTASPKYASVYGIAQHCSAP